MNTPVPPLITQESQGLYQEAVSKLVDQIEDAAKRGDVAGPDIVPELMRTAGLLPYARDFELALTALLWSKNVQQREIAEIYHIAKEIVRRDVLAEYVKRHGEQPESKELPKMPNAIDPFTVVIDVSGGVVQAVFADLPLKVVLVDWDNINEGDDACVYGHYPLRDMSEEQLSEVNKT